jgi:hypothetical protein
MAYSLYLWSLNVLRVDLAIYYIMPEISVCVCVCVCVYIYVYIYIYIYGSYTYVVKLLLDLDSRELQQTLNNGGFLISSSSQGII